MKTTRLNDIIPAALFLLGLGLITSSLGIRSLQADAGWQTTEIKENAECVATDPDPSCATCEGGDYKCSENIPDFIDKGECKIHSGAFGLVCLEGWFDCGDKIDCDDPDGPPTLLNCNPVTGLCQPSSES